MQDLHHNCARQPRLNCKRLISRFPITVNQLEERVRDFSALDHGWSRHSPACPAEAATEQSRTGAKAGHAGQLLDRQTLVAGAVGRSVDWVAGRK